MSNPINTSNKVPHHNDSGREENCYAEALCKYCNEKGDAIIAKKNAQRMALIFALIAFSSLGLNVYQASLSRYMPIIVQTDAKTGAVIGSPMTINNNKKPNEKEIQYFLWQVIQKTRTIPLDPIMFRKNWEDAYKFLTQGAVSKLTNYANTENQKKLLEDGFASVAELKSYSNLPGEDNTYQIRWQETFFDKNGKVVSKTMMTGFFVVEFAEITDPLINPFGLEIKDCNITKEI